jgi:hypothetical protein
MTPLPFAPPPKDSNLYQQLESTTLQTLTADQLDAIRAKTFSQGTEGNEDEYRRLLLLGLAADSISLSGPIPGTSQISGATGADTNQTLTIFEGVAGQVWEMIAADFRSNNASTRAQLRIYVGSDEVEIGDESGHGGTEPFDPKGNFGRIWIDANSALKAELTSMAAGREIEINAYLVRVR